MRPLLLSGGPAVGKTTCGRRLAEERSRAAYVDSDDIRQLVVAGAATLWSGPDGQKQHVLAAHNIAAIASNLSSAGYDVTIAEILTPDTLAVYRDKLPGCFSVHLSITLEEAAPHRSEAPLRCSSGTRQRKCTRGCARTSTITPRRGSHRPQGFQ